jgi:hypothetical protein
VQTLAQAYLFNRDGGGLFSNQPLVHAPVAKIITRRLIVIIANTNAVPDDDYIVYINGVDVGRINLGEWAVVGSVFYMKGDQGPAISDAVLSSLLGFAGIPPSLALQHVRTEAMIIQGSNNIYMKNVQNNDTGNAGDIVVAKYVNDSKYISLFLEGFGLATSNGEDWTTTFDIDLTKTS